MSFKSDERQYQLDWKGRTKTLSVEALRPGVYTGPPDGHESNRDEMFLHEAHSEENLLPFVRREALDIFQRADIDWHDSADNRRPSNYLLDSMVSCVNCLMPFANDGVALARLFLPLVPNAVEALPVEDSRMLSFEWMGVDNPLGETSRKRKRGSHGTSVDVFCVLKRADGGHTGLLVEWKYTESYPKDKQEHGHHYVPLLEAADGPVDLAQCGDATVLFVNPLYQLARQQLLAQATERGRVFGCDRVMVVVVVPEGNLGYRGHVPAAALRRRFPGLSLADVWTRLLRRPDRFALISFDRLLANFHDDAFPTIAPALQEMRARYFRGGFGGE
ncbi:MAG: hypothetical protein ABI560_16725 [Myxococcales bacterium]